MPGIVGPEATRSDRGVSAFGHTARPFHAKRDQRGIGGQGKADEIHAYQKSHSTRAERNTSGRRSCPIGLLRSVWSGYRRGDGDTQFAGVVKQVSAKGAKRWLYKQLEQLFILRRKVNILRRERAANRVHQLDSSSAGMIEAEHSRLVVRSVHPFWLGGRSLIRINAALPFTVICLLVKL